MEPEVLQLEDSLDGDIDVLWDGGPPSIGSGADIAPPPPVAVTTPVPVSSKKKFSGKKPIIGYILYSSEMRRCVVANHPESSFGEISRIVGNEWRNLPAEEKQYWEEKAAKVNEENAAKAEEEEATVAASSSSTIVTTPAASPTVAVITPISFKKKQVTGYILYSSVTRRSVRANHPESSFGEISRIVGNEWRNLPAEEKQCWEEKAAKVNKETAAKAVEAAMEEESASLNPDNDLIIGIP